MSIDHNYARGKLKILLRDLSNYNAGEFWREMSRIASGATASIHAEGLKAERDAMADSNTQLSQQNEEQIRMNAKLMHERDEYHSHLNAIAEMTGNGDDIGAAHEGVNAVVEDLNRHKRMFAAACETLGEIQQVLGNEIVGCEPVLVKELVEERDALAAHVEALSSNAVALANACENKTDLPLHKWAVKCAMLVNRVYKAAEEKPTTTLARHDANILREYADKLEADEAPDAEAGDMWDASQCADWMREQADKAEAQQ
ncbi:Mce/MlaD family protein [Halomonas colorata]|uniref:hypothetical protein n=1 Tax=Halomonas colorata TaxID=2742615 RepID=UPI00186625D7|nr:hypothetical protein [Halomonas colorata]